MNKRLAVGLAVMMLGATALYGCTSSSKKEAPAATATQTTAPATMSAAEMDKMHEAVMKAFPAKTEGKGGQPLQPEIVNGVKVFHLTVQKIQWETSPGHKVEAMAYNGQIPGPMIRVTEGEKFQVVVKNEMPESTSVHWHGLLIPNQEDGVTYVTQDPIKTGETYTYNLVATNPGTQMYHSHHNSTEQVTNGLYGPLIVDPKDPATKSKYHEDVDYSMMLSDGTLGFTINGKEFPATEPIVLKQGQKLRIRYANAGQQIHTMHLHGLTQLVVEKDGYPLPEPYKADTILIGPGERYDVIVEANNPGTWALHCHVLGHAESDHGMHGMVTAVIVQ